MTKFEEMRLRAIRFCELAKLGINIRPVAEVITIDSDLAWYNAHCQIRGHEERWRRITHDEFIKEAEKIGNIPFPTLLEAQGWIAVEDAPPESDQWTQIRIVNYNEVLIGTSRNFESSGKGQWFLGVQWKYSNDTCIEARTEYLRVTHWKPLEVFPQPFEPSNV